MMEILRFDDRFSERFSKLSPDGAEELRSHGDVVPGSAFAAVEDGTFYGAGYLVNAQGDFVNLAFTTDVSTERGIDAAEALLSALIAFFLTSLKAGRPKSVLRLWGRESMTDYRAFLQSFGFQVRDRMLIMERDLGSKGEAKTHNAESPQTAAGPETSHRIVKVDLSDSFDMARYLDATARAFGVPDREAEMRFRIGRCGGIVYGVLPEQGGFPVSFLTTWPIDHSTGATENVFTDNAYRKQGLAGALLDHAAQALLAEGLRTARLTVYESDAEAVSLYKKHAYQITDTLLEYHYDDSEA